MTKCRAGFAIGLDEGKAKASNLIILVESEIKPHETCNKKINFKQFFEKRYLKNDNCLATRYLYQGIDGE